MSNLPNINIGSMTSSYTAITNIVKQYLRGFVGTCIPVTVVSIPEGKNNYVNVQPVLQNITTTGDVLPTENAVYYNIPMMTLQGGVCQIEFPPVVGDYGLLVASKFDISQYKNNHAESPVGSDRTFSFSDGFYLPLSFNPKSEGVYIKNAETIVQILPDSVNVTTTKVIVNSAESIEATTKTATLNAEESVSVTTKTATLNTETATVEASDSVNINANSATITASSVDLGGSGGAGVSRIGDAVQVVVESGSSAGTWSGTIIAGSGVVKAI